MSRIDEALKRVTILDPKAADLMVHRRLEPVDDRPVLESYAPEARSADVPPKPRDELVVSTVSAPRAASGHQLGPFDPAVEGKLVGSDHMSAISVEQYRRLAGTLHELQVERGLRALMVTSALPSEGKTLTVANLALTLSQAYRRRVLLIDCDLRRPAVHHVFRLPNTVGLSDVLNSEREDVPVLELSTHLSVLTAGRPDAAPMAGLTSERMRKLLEQFTNQFDWVLLDATPIGFMPDAQLLAALTGAVLFVIEAGATPHHLVSRAITELGPDCVVGTVLNRVSARDIPATGYYHAYYSQPAD